MEINWLHDFLAVATTRSFSRAAEQRNCSQPALSRRIQALEVWTGAALLERTTHSVNLTPAGEGFRETAEDVLRRLAAGRLDAQERARRLRRAEIRIDQRAVADLLSRLAPWHRKQAVVRSERAAGRQSHGSL